MAVYRLIGQRRPSKALVDPSVTDPQTALAHLLDVEKLADFRWFQDHQLAAGAASDKSSAPADFDGEKVSTLHEKVSGQKELYPPAVPSVGLPPDRDPLSPPPDTFSPTCSERFSSSANAEVNAASVQRICALVDVRPVLPLVAAWLVGDFKKVSIPTAKRAIARILANPPANCRMAVYRLPKQRGHPSKALIQRDVSDPQAALEAVLGVKLREFHMTDVASTTPPEVGGGYGPLLDPAVLFPPFDAPTLPDMSLSIRGRPLAAWRLSSETIQCRPA